MVVVHCSDSNFGNAALIDHWHRQRGFNKIGYMYIILNGKISKQFPYQKFLDGMIETGRHIQAVGAHCKGKNKWIGICLIGKYSFSPAQFRSLVKLVKHHKIKRNQVHGHREYANKTCPNFDVQEVLKRYW